MVWVPGVDEVPMSLSYIGWKGKISAITVKNVGETTKTIHQFKKGTKFGLRGPYGKGFKIVSGEVLIVGGGVGVTPLYPLLLKLRKFKGKPTSILGAKTKKELLFVHEVEKILGKKSVLIVTEDGSMGIKGLASDVLAEILDKKGCKYRQIYACGPEPMLKKVLDLSLKHKIPAQLSLERYIKCGVGLCGSCMVDGFRICKDGPVFSSKILAKLKEFGFVKRESSGKIVKI